VLTLPERNPINCKFYRVHEPNENLATLTRIGFYPVPTINSPVAAPGPAVSEIDARMIQAGVAVSPGSPITERVVDYEPNNGGNGALDTDAEFAVMAQKRQEGVFDGACNIIYVADLDTRDGSLGYVDDPASKLVFISQNSWVDYDDFHPDPKVLAPEDRRGASFAMTRVIAHEFGHYLEISTREEGKVTPTGDHDVGKYPAGTVPLMRPGPDGGLGHWIRHEDWAKASETAKTRLQ